MSSQRIRLLLLDDHVLFRRLRYLASETDFETVADTSRRFGIDIVLLDFDLEDETVW